MSSFLYVGGTVEEAKNLWIAEKKANKEVSGTTEKTLEEFINELVNNKYLTEDEKDNILGKTERGTPTKQKTDPQGKEGFEKGTEI